MCIYIYIYTYIHLDISICIDIYFSIYIQFHKGLELSQGYFGVVNESNACFVQEKCARTIYESTPCSSGAESLSLGAGG